MTQLSTKHVIITGGGGGIGSAIADSLDRSAANITLMGRSISPLQKACRRLANAQAITVDVTDDASIKQAFTEARNNFGSIDILINNAGIATSAPFIKIDNHSWSNILDVNLNGVFYCCREVLPDMLETGWGRIINIASIAGLQGSAYVAAYCAAKHGVIGLTRSLALEVAQKNITVNAICPGYTNTEMLNSAIENISTKTGMNQEQAAEQLKAVNPQHRFIEPEEVAASVTHLCLPGSESITGQSLVIAGGEIM